MYNKLHEEETRVAAGKRLNILFVLIFAALAVLIFRLSFVQLVRGEYFLNQAEGNRYIEQLIPSPRGAIYDRDHRLLVTNKPVSSITFTLLSQDTQDRAKIAAKLAPVFGRTPEQVIEAMDLHGQHYMLSMPRKLMRNATPQQVAYVKEHQHELPGVNVVLDSIRDYRYGKFASHIVGYLNHIPDKYWQEHQDEYQQTDMIGMGGVEKSYETYLRGEKGLMQVEVNMKNQPLREQTTEPPIRGYDLVLSIDSKLQRATENALSTHIGAMKQRVRTVENAAAIAMNPKTGEILAMASYPDYDPNMWVKGVVDQKEYEDVFLPAEMNRALTQTYQPGSTVKMATTLIGLKEKVITPWTVIADPGKIQVGYIANGQPNYIRSWKAIGFPDAYRALAESSNVYMIRTFLDMARYQEDMPTAQVNRFLADTLPKTMDKILAYHKEFGLGETMTDVDLPYEEPGEITREGYVSDLAFTAIGQSEKYTLMQLAQYVSTLANDGKRMKPHVVKEMISPIDGSVLKAEPQVMNQIPFAIEHIQAVQRGMRDVVRQPYGTFHSVFGSYPVAVAGKTGTAETGRGTENSLFVGYAPYDDPQIAIAVIVPDVQQKSHSSEILGPISRAIMDTYFGYAAPPALPKPRN